MANAEEVHLWIEALSCFNNGLLEDALSKFQRLSPNSKIIFNIACCYLHIKDTIKARQKLNEAIVKDPHLAIGYFMLGQLKYSVRQFKESLECYKSAYAALRGRDFVDYRPLGLKYVLYAWQVLTNQAIVSCKLKLPEMYVYITEASEMADTNQQNQLQDIRNAMQKSNASLLKYLVKFKANVLFTPPNDSMNNANKKDYLGQAKVISTENDKEIYSAFSGTKDHASPAAFRKPPVVSNRNPPSFPPPLNPKFIPPKPLTENNRKLQPVKLPPPQLSTKPAKSPLAAKPLLPSAKSTTPPLAAKPRTPPLPVKPLSPPFSGNANKNIFSPQRSNQNQPANLSKVNGMKNPIPLPTQRRDEPVKNVKPEPLWKRPKPPVPVNPISKSTSPDVTKRHHFIKNITSTTDPCNNKLNNDINSNCSQDTPVKPPRPKLRPSKSLLPSKEATKDMNNNGRIITENKLNVYPKTASNKYQPSCSPTKTLAAEIQKRSENNDTKNIPVKPPKPILSPFNNNNNNSSNSNDNNSSNNNKINNIRNIATRPDNKPIKPNRPIQPQILKPRVKDNLRRRYSNDDSIYSVPDFVQWGNSTVDQGMTKQSSSLEDIPKLEKVLYGNIFANVKDNENKRIAPTTQVPVLTDEAKRFNPNIPNNNKPKKPLPVLVR